MQDVGCGRVKREMQKDGMGHHFRATDILIRSRCLLSFLSFLIQQLVSPVGLAVSLCLAIEILILVPVLVSVSILLLLTDGTHFSFSSFSFIPFFPRTTTCLSCFVGSCLALSTKKRICYFLASLDVLAHDQRPIYGINYPYPLYRQQGCKEHQ